MVSGTVLSPGLSFAVQSTRERVENILICICGIYPCLSKDF